MRKYGLLLNADKTKIISIIKERKYKNIKLKIEIYNDTIWEIEENEPFTYLEFELKIKNGIIDINNHIENMEKKNNFISLQLNNMGFNIYMNDMKIRKLIIESLNISKLSYALIFVPMNQNQIKRLNNVPIKLMKNMIKVYRSTKNSILRILYGIPPTEAFIHYHQLLFWCKFKNEKYDNNNNLNITFVTLYADAILTVKEIQKCIKRKFIII